MTGGGWVWAVFALLLAVLGARAWVVETGRGRLGRTPAKVQVLTGVAGVVLVGLVVLLAVDGGLQLADLLRRGGQAGSAPAPAAPADPVVPANR